jgi:hypothetical protein
MGRKNEHMSDDKKKDTSSHYIDNKVFYDEMVKWKKAIRKAKKEGLPPPPVTEYIGQCFISIAERLSYRPNFLSHARYRDEMIGDGIENCLMYAANFDPKQKSKNPFAYFTQIIYYAFVRRIQKEKKQNYIKFKSIEMAHVQGKIPKWLSQAFHDHSKVDEFFRSLSLSDTDLNNFEGRRKKASTNPSTMKPIKSRKPKGKK